jgi:hypothetical protein
MGRQDGGWKRESNADGFDSQNRLPSRRLSTNVPSSTSSTSTASTEQLLVVSLAPPSRFTITSNLADISSLLLLLCVCPQTPAPWARVAIPSTRALSALALSSSRPLSPYSLTLDYNRGPTTIARRTNAPSSSLIPIRRAMRTTRTIRTRTAIRMPRPSRRGRGRRRRRGRRRWMPWTTRIRTSTVR